MQALLKLIHSITPHTKISSALQITFNVYEINNIYSTERYSVKICN